MDLQRTSRIARPALTRRFGSRARDWRTIILSHETGGQACYFGPSSAGRGRATLQRVERPFGGEQAGRGTWAHRSRLHGVRGILRRSLRAVALYRQCRPIVDFRLNDGDPPQLQTSPAVDSTSVSSGCDEAAGARTVGYAVLRDPMILAIRRGIGCETEGGAAGRLRDEPFVPVQIQEGVGLIPKLPNSARSPG